jgi:hypothetical protein
MIEAGAAARSSQALKALEFVGSGVLGRLSLLSWGQLSASIRSSGLAFRPMSPGFSSLSPMSQAGFTFTRSIGARLRLLTPEALRPRKGGSMMLLTRPGLSGSALLADGSLIGRLRR